MTLRVSGKNLDIGDALRGQVEGRLATALGKYVDRGAYAGHVTVMRDGVGFRTECVLHLSGTTLEASGAAGDAYSAFDQAAEKIEKRLRRHKRRLTDRPTGANGKAAPIMDTAAYSVIEEPTEEALEDGEYHPVVIAEDTRSLHRLSVSDAVVELDLTGAPVVVFVHAGTGRMNVVYRRGDGAIGWIDPPSGQA